MTVKANAYPKKHFFFEMFTRDISLEDCILDLIDNSIDGLIRTKNIDVSAGAIMSPVKDLQEKEKAALPTVELTYDNDKVTLADTCGGISRKVAKDSLFTFGHAPEEPSTGHLGVYGIGLKRAIFKIGDDFEMVSRTASEGFRTKLDLPKWAAKDDGLEDWTFPLEYIEGARTERHAGTTITLKRLRPDVKTRLGDGTFEGTLTRLIAQTYSFFLDRYVRICVNGVPVPPKRVDIGQSDDVQSGKDEFESNGVSVTIIASIQSGDYPSAGWYALCNARVIVAADKSDLTGWGIGAMPAFHSKYVRFVGAVFFHSEDPLKLPWTTTKRGLNRESQVYQEAKARMAGIARPIITFLNNLYPSEAPESSRERKLAESVAATDVRHLLGGGPRAFQAISKEKTPAKTTVRVQYDAPTDDITKIRKHLRKPSLGANQVGKYTFEDYMKREGLK